MISELCSEFKGSLPPSYLSCTSIQNKKRKASKEGICGNHLFYWVYEVQFS